MNHLFRLTVWAIYLACSFASPVAGDMTFFILDYPTQQDGHTVSGSITTSDSAADDGLLMSSEILSWAFEVTGPNNFSASSLTSTSPVMPASGSVGITATEITLAMPADGDINGLEFFGGADEPSLRYLRVNDIMGAGVSDLYSAAVTDTGGAEVWQTDPATLAGEPWVIASNIPEPSAYLMMMTSLGLFTLVRRYGVKTADLRSRRGSFVANRTTTD